MTTVRGIEAIKLYMPAGGQGSIDTNVREERGKLDASTAVHQSTMTSVDRYRQEWRQVLDDLDERPERIRDKALNGDLKVSKFRSVHWALLLRVLNADHRGWQQQRQQQRLRYDKLRHEFVKNPHEIEVPDDDPLSQSTQSVWNQYFSDQELFAVIRQDVVRTFPGVDFFRKALIQNAMTNILFYYAREHPYMCYRQGMHEILAPILFVMYGDHQALLHFEEIAKTQIDATLLDVLKPDYLEADSYSIFSRLMSAIESYYRITNSRQSQEDFCTAHANHSSGATSEVEVISQLNSIRDKILAKEDLHLHNYLLKLDIPLHIFGIRWLRLLFGREFALLDLLVLWDAIFADSDRFDLPNYLLVAMLIRIRDKLLLSDYTTCLTYLMRYPTNVDISLILRHALHMQMPKKFERPANAIVYFSMNSNDVPVPPKQDDSNVLLPSSTMLRRRDQTAQQHQLRSRSTSLGDSARVERQITLLQARNAEDAAALAKLKLRIENDSVIMDGYVENSPELMRLELKNAQTIITIARSKLQTYLGTVRKHSTSRNGSDDLTQALDGIEELCSFLDVKFMFPFHGRRTGPIDQALEANEKQRQRKSSSPGGIATESNGANRKPHIQQETSNPHAVDTAISDEQTTVRASAQLCLPPQSSSMPTQSANGNISYERPDNSFMFNSSRLLGNLKEIELIPITVDEKVVRPLNAASEQNDTISILADKANGLPSVDPLRTHME